MRMQTCVICREYKPEEDVRPTLLSGTYRCKDACTTTYPPNWQEWDGLVLKFYELKMPKEVEDRVLELVEKLSDLCEKQGREIKRLQEELEQEKEKARRR